MTLQSREKQLIKNFLSEYKKLIEKRTGEDFSPRHLAIISMPKTRDKLDWVAYHKWFDEVDVGITYCTSHNFIEAFLEMPIHVLIQAEQLGRPMLSKGDQKKLTNAMKLLGELRIIVK